MITCGYICTRGCCIAASLRWRSKDPPPTPGYRPGRRRAAAARRPHHRPHPAHLSHPRHHPPPVAGGRAQGRRRQALRLPLLGLRPRRPTLPDLRPTADGGGGRRSQVFLVPVLPAGVSRLQDRSEPSLEADRHLPPGSSRCRRRERFRRGALHLEIAESGACGSSRPRSAAKTWMSDKTSN